MIMKAFIIGLMAFLGTVIVIFVTTGLPAMIIGAIAYLLLVKVFSMAPMSLLAYWGIGWLVVLARRTLK